MFYECEEIDDEANGLRLLAQAHPELIEADFAVLMEPSNAGVEAGCQGTLRAYVRTSGSVPTREIVVGQQRDPRCGGHPQPAQRLRVAQPAH